MPRSKSVTVTIPKPCQENWETMRPDSCGRFCSQCEQTVIDFSILPDDKVARILHTHRTTALCGRFSSTQLNRSFEYIPARKHFSLKTGYKKIAAVLFLTPAIPQQVFALEQKEQNATTQKPASGTRIRLQGKIADVATGEPLIGMEISIAGIGIKYSDKDGNFSFVIPEEFRGKSITVEANYQPSSSKEKPKSVILEETLLIDASGNDYAITLFSYPLEKIGYKEGSDLTANLTISTPPPPTISGHVKYKEPEQTNSEIKKQQQTKGYWMRFKSLFKKKNNKI